MQPIQLGGIASSMHCWRWMYQGAVLVVIIVGKYLQEMNSIINSTFHRISQWMNSVVCIHSHSFADGNRSVMLQVRREGLSQIDVWLHRHDGEVYYYMMWIRLGCWCVRPCFHKFQYEDFLACSSCILVYQNAAHVLLSGHGTLPATDENSYTYSQTRSRSRDLPIIS